MSKFLGLIKDVKKVDFDEVLKCDRPVIFDTNFLFVTFQFRVDIIEELNRVVGAYDLFIFEGTLSELEDIENRKVKNKKYLPLIAKMIKLYNIKVIKSDESYVDDVILGFANYDSKLIFATNDKQLRMKLRDKKAHVLYLRQRRFFELS